MADRVSFAAQLVATHGEPMRQAMTDARRRYAALRSAAEADGCGRDSGTVAAVLTTLARRHKRRQRARVRRIHTNYARRHHRA